MSDEIHAAGEKFFDLRVVELSKSSRSSRLCEKLKAADENSYVCLGHFDFLRISPLEGEDPLKCVEEDFKKRDNYNYPLYILHDSTKDSAALTGFWETKSCFMTVSRIHFTPTGKKGVDCIREALEKLHEGFPLRGEQPGELSIEVYGELVVLKSNSILSCLQAIRRMMEVPVVGNVYSFCGVHGELCDPRIEEAMERWDASAPRLRFKQSAKEAMEQAIPYASVRFSVIATRNAKLFWSQTKRPPYYVTGKAYPIIN